MIGSSGIAASVSAAGPIRSSMRSSSPARAQNGCPTDVNSSLMSQQISRPPGARPWAMHVAEYVAKPVPGLITRLVVPGPKSGRVAACRNARASANSLSIVSAAVSVTLVRGTVERPVIALGGVAGHVGRLTAVEDALDGGPLPGLDELQALVSRAVRPAGDLSGSAAFRRYQAGVTVALALQDAVGRKRGRS